MTKTAAPAPCALLAAGLLVAGCAGGPVAGDANLQNSHPFPTREATPGHQAHPIHGIDVAKFQGEIDWAQLRQSGVAFAFIKATEGADRLDTKFQQNWQAARAAGIARGAYHFNYWCSAIEDQIAWYQRHVPVERDSLPPILDLEWNRHSPTCPQKFPKEVVLPRIKKWLVAMERHYGKKPIIYVDGPFYKDVLSGGELAEYPMWLSNMRGLPQEKFPGRQWAFWQYTYKGRLPGVRGEVDRNVFAGSPGQWKQLAAAGFAGDGVTATGDVTIAPKPAAAPVVVAAAPAAAPIAPSTAVATLPPNAPLPPSRPGATIVVADVKEDELPPAPEPKVERSFWQRMFSTDTVR